MRDFLLSKNSNYPFSLFGMQHIIMILITIFLFIIIYLLKNRLIKTSQKKQKIVRLIILFILLINMLIYRLSYMFYGIYQIEIHLSLYYCHIVNYLFILALLINYNPFYKIVYGLSWIGAIWTVFFPDVSGGIDCFIFYTSFISHNLLLVFTTFILVIKKIKYKSLDFIKSIIICIIIITFTHLVNYDFGTNFNTLNSILGKYVNFGTVLGYTCLFFMALIGNLIGFLINKIYLQKK